MCSKLPGSWIIIEFAEIAQYTMHSNFENREREWVCLVVNARSRQSRWRGPSWRYKELETVEMRRNGTKDKDKKGSRRRYMEPVRNAIWLGPASSWFAQKYKSEWICICDILCDMNGNGVKSHDRPDMPNHRNRITESLRQKGLADGTCMIMKMRKIFQGQGREIFFWDGCCGRRWPLLQQVSKFVPMVSLWAVEV